MLDMAERTSSKKGVVIETTTVTPSIAAAWLDKNVQNRKRNARFVSRFARDMKNGDWQMTGDSIKFDKLNNLVDGQHRLTACVESGVNFKTIVVYGLEPASRDVVDTGKPRTNGDVLAMHGATNSVAVAATLRFLINEKRGFNEKTAITHSELVEAFARHPNIGLYVPHPGFFPRSVSPFIVGYVNYVGSTLLHNKKGRAQAMMDVLKTGCPDYDDDPIHAYRERVIRAATSREKIVGNRAANASTFKYCWNAFAKREPIKRLKVQKTDFAIDGLDLDRL